MLLLLLLVFIFVVVKLVSVVVIDHLFYVRHTAVTDFKRISVEIVL